MYIKCLYSTGGNLISETIYSPASQLDVVGTMRGGIRGYCRDHIARYKQALRHMWGSRMCASASSYNHTDSEQSIRATA